MNESQEMMGPEETDELDTLERLIGKALLDEGFRAYLLEDPAGATAQAGIKLSEFQLQRLKSLNPDAVEVIAAGFEKGMHLDSLGAARLW